MPSLVNSPCASRRCGRGFTSKRSRAGVAELAGIRLTAKRIERSAETDGAAAAQRLTAESTAIARRTVAVLPAPSGRREAPDKLYIAIDGTGVPMVPAAVADRAGKTGEGRARTREAKLAALFTQTRIDDAGRPVRDPDSTSYLASFAPAAEFATQVAAEARRRGADTIRQLVVLGDGAPWIWNLATAILPERPPPSWTSTTPANTCTTSPRTSPASSATPTPSGWPPA